MSLTAGAGHIVQALCMRVEECVWYVGTWRQNLIH